MWSAAFRVLDVIVAVATDHEGIAETVGHLTATYEPADERRSDLSYRLLTRPAPLLELDGEPCERPSHWLDLTPLFERSLYDQAVARCQDEWFLHGAALATGHGAIVLIGPSDAGKSTLAMALTAHGWHYIADEIVALDGTLQVRGVTRPIAFTNRPPGGMPAGFSQFHYWFRGPLGKHWAILAQPPPDRLCRTPQPVRHVVTLSRRDGQPAALLRLPTGEGLCALWQETLLPTSAALARATALLDARTVHRLESGTPEAAVAAICELVEREP